MTRLIPQTSKYKLKVQRKNSQETRKSRLSCICHRREEPSSSTSGKKTNTETSFTRNFPRLTVGDLAHSGLRWEKPQKPAPPQYVFRPSVNAGHLSLRKGTAGSPASL